MGGWVVLPDSTNVWVAGAGTLSEIDQDTGEVRQTGISTLIVDRNYRAVLAHTDRAVVLQKGKVAMAGDSSVLVSDPTALAGLLGV